MSEMEMWLVRFSYLLMIGIFIFIWLLFLKARYSKMVVGKVLCESITPEGNGRSKLNKVEGGVLAIPPEGKNAGRKYTITDIATYLVDFPAVPFWLAIIQTKVKKAVFDEESWEPLTNRCGRLLLNPRRLYNLGNERFSQVGLAQSEEKAKEVLPTKKMGGGFSWGTIMLLGILLLLIIGGVVLVSKWPSISAALGVK